MARHRSTSLPRALRCMASQSLTFLSPHLPSSRAHAALSRKYFMASLYHCPLKRRRREVSLLARAKHYLLRPGEKDEERAALYAQCCCAKQWYGRRKRKKGKRKKKEGGSPLHGMLRGREKGKEEEVAAQAVTVGCDRHCHQLPPFCGVKKTALK